MSAAAQVEQLTAALAGQYAVGRVLGRGGMATVYEAVDVRHHRRVAIKVLDPQLGAALGAERFPRERQLSVEEALRIAVAVAGALDYAHRHGVLHRDLKPENILLQDGEALVADFGIARAIARAADTDSLTGTGVTLGTPQYMSPEQAAGERELDARTDVYSLGCVLYEMLAGEPPFTGATAQAIIAKVMTEEPAPLGQLRRAVPPHV